MLSCLRVALAGCHVLPEYRNSRARLPLSRSRTPVDHRESRWHGEPRRRVRAVTRKLAAHRRHRAARLSPGGDAATSARRRCSPATASSCSSTARAPTAAMFAAIEQARDYVLVESFIFEEAVDGDRTLSALLARRGARAACTSTCSTTRSARSPPTRNFSTGCDAAGISLCAFNPLNPLDERFSGRQSARPSQDRGGRRRRRLRRRHQLQPGLSHRLQPGAAPRPLEAEVARRRAGATRTSRCAAPARTRARAACSATRWRDAECQGEVSPAFRDRRGRTPATRWCRSSPARRMTRATRSTPRCFR